jgi:N-acetyl-anhydromuramyl-L-alanine amidase AmpD
MAMERKINKIIIHCSATPKSMDIGSDVIRKWHVEGNGWSDIGYHYVIRRDGIIEGGRIVERAGAHTKGHNRDSIGVCMVGGIDSRGKATDNFTEEQWRAIERLTRMLMTSYKGATVHGHNEFSNKACPSFDVQEWLKKVKIL